MRKGSEFIQEGWEDETTTGGNARSSGKRVCGEKKKEIPEPSGVTEAIS